MRLIILATTLLALAPATFAQTYRPEHSRSRPSGRHGLPEPPSAASKRREWPARPGELWNSRRTESLPSTAAQSATDVSSEPRVIDP